MSKEFEGSYLQALKSWAYLPVHDVRLVELLGSDRLEWLQGQATNDLRPIAHTSGSISFCLCQATGQLGGLYDAWCDSARIVVASDSAGAALLQDRAEKMVILEDVEAREIEHWNEGVKNSAAALDEPLRIEAGIPKRGQDYNEKTLPPELGPAFEKKYISYNKGCYTGQEVLMRIHSRGHTNKTWVGLLLDAPVEARAKVTSVNGEEVGVVTSAAVSPRLGAIAAAMLRNEAAQEGAEVSVAGVHGRVKNFPLI